MAEIARWPIATVVVMTAIAIMIMMAPDDALVPEKLAPKTTPTPLDIGILTAGYLLGILGGKALLLFGLYPRLHKAAFPGSYLVTSYIILVPIFALYAAFMIVVPKLIGDELPGLAVVAFLAFSYLLFGALCAAGMRMIHFMTSLGRGPFTSEHAIHRDVEQGRPKL